MISPSLFNINTHNTTKRKNKCFKKRPCYRHWCTSCIAARKRSIVRELFPRINELQLDQHVTITFVRYTELVEEAFDLLLRVRPKLLRKLRKMGPTICCASVTANSSDDNRYVPHFHMLCGDGVEKTVLVGFLADLCGYDVNIRATKLEATEANLSRLIGYWLDQNIRPSSRNKPKYMRLLTGPKGINLGRPRYRKVPVEFALLEELTRGNF